MSSHTISPDLPPDAVLYGVSWSTGLAQLRLRGAAEASSSLESLVGRRFSYRGADSDRRWCLGHRPVGATPSLDVVCTASPEPGSKFCPKCAVKEANFAANLHHAHTRDRSSIAADMQEHLRQVNFLYLAGFRDGSVKVGTSTQSRLPVRLAEQGAWRAVIVAEASDGYAVRDAEDRVTMDVGLPQSVSARRKLDGFEHPMDDVGLEAELRRWAGVVHELLDRMGDERVKRQAELWATQVSDDLAWKRLHRYPLALAIGSHDFTVHSVCGRYIALKREGGDDLFVADLQQLYGRQLDIGDYGSDEVAVQDSLF